MNLLPIEVVTLAGDKLVTDSRRVAQHFDKQHKTVLRAFDGLRCSDEFNRRNFVPIEYIDARGRPQRAVQMTKNGFIFLALRFTGEKADAIREAFINAFDAMTEQLQRRDLSVWQQMQALIAKEVDSRSRASFGSRLLHKRRREIPHFRRERARLEGQIQGALPLEYHQKGSAPTAGTVEAPDAP